MAKQSLGKGFDALLPKDLDTSMLEQDNSRVHKILIQDIVPNPDQPRREFDPATLQDLSNSIKTHGVLQPIIVVRSGKGYRIVAGERRWRAAKDAGLKDMPAIVRSLEELDELELSLIENLQRVDLSPMEQALSVYRLQQQFNLNLEQIAEKLGKATSTVSNLNRLLQLPDDARRALENNQITEGHARSILALKAWPDRQAELLSSILNNNWTVRQAEQFVIETKKQMANQHPADQAKAQELLATRLSKKLTTDVVIKPTAKGGQLIIKFSSTEQLERLGDKLLS